MTVLDFNARLERKRKEREEEEAWALTRWFMAMFGDQPMEMRLQIAQAMADKDEQRYMELTHPILAQKIEEFNGRSDR